ncbi:hypothetical protein DFJ58DRAFT_838028 [Suillus subalutaceus]|uniref:uncharacterized protein n=1 Tax=Suillus subalutaceus TaxID=48586 RepID=UPI001B862D5C|nr:uncharacterized protein DFJ58DRAFT_838028 [Suillus subalutaceus]KAG1867791.1 hypothetical protein DFJ58DRAFT_838028 [Suillus subalutaceus]
MIVERLQQAEEEIEWLRRENELLMFQKDAAETHCYFSAQMADHYKARLNKKLDDKTRKGSSKKRTKPYSRVLTSEEGRAELRELEADQAERERQEEASKQKKVAEEQGKRDRRAEQERSQAAFTGAIKTKKLEELRDVAAALRLPETGLKAELLQRILQHFNDHPGLKKNQRYDGLFNPPRSRRRRLENDNSVAPEFPQDMIPANSIQQPSRYQPQLPVTHSSMSAMDLPPPGYAPPYYSMHHSVPRSPPVLHPPFTPVGSASMSQDFRVGGVQMYDIGGSGDAGRQLYESRLYQQYHYNHNN